jgi:prolyl-tRNA synthetase
LVWPVSVAPYEAVITVMKIDDEATMNAANALYEELQVAGIDVLIDDRDARAGVKFADSELIGIPYRVTVGPRGFENGLVELTDRSTMETTEVAVADIAQKVISVVSNAR